VSIRYLVTAVSRGLAWAAALLLFLACVVVSWSVMSRYVFAASTVWQSEFVKYAVVAATLLGSPYVLALGGHVGIDLFATRVSGTLRRVQLLVGGAIGLAFCCVLAMSAGRYFAEAWHNGWVTESVWAPPLWAVLAPFPLGIGWLTLQYVVELIEKLRAVGTEAGE
jgi:TRAP-type C4-dicarboxylate transport system permease small subunit